MDRVISVATKRKQNIRNITLGLSIPLALVVVFLLIRKAIKPHLISGNIKTSLVEYGTVAETISTSGTVELENKFTILAPFTTILKTIKASPGQMVNTGDTLLILDESPVRKSYKNMLFELEKLKSRKLQTRLKFDNKMLDQEFNLNTKKVELARLQTVWEDQRALLVVGGSSESKVKQAVRALKLTEDEVILMFKKNEIGAKELKAELRDIAVEISIKNEQIEAIRRRLKQMTLLAA